MANNDQLAKKQKIEHSDIIKEMTQDDLLTLVIKCANFAAVKHSRQRRHNLEQTPYINHPIGVCNY